MLKYKFTHKGRILLSDFLYTKFGMGRGPKSSFSRQISPAYCPKLVKIAFFGIHLPINDKERIILSVFKTKFGTWEGVRIIAPNFTVYNCGVSAPKIEKLGNFLV